MNNRYTLFIVLLFCMHLSYSQTEFFNEIIAFQNDLNKDYSDSISSPLTSEDLAVFSGLNFFPPDEKFRIQAKFVTKFNPVTVILKTTTDRAPRYVLFAEVYFNIDETPVKLNVFKSEKKVGVNEEEEHIFLPFTDLSNGISTYEGGRYVDLQMPQGDSIMIDFNKAYNPYCAYNHKYSCVVPPAENFIKAEINAGVKKALLKK